MRGSVFVSVVVPTYKRPELMERCLKALCSQDYPKNLYEIRIADDASEEIGVSPSRGVVEAFASSCGVRVVYVPVRGRHGPAAARNRGWERARGEIIAFTDDDTVPGKGWLRAGVEAFLEPSSTSVLAVTGKTIVPISRNPTDYELNESGLSRAEFITANCFVRRSALDAIGGFDESFRLAWREDSDLQFRLMKFGGGEDVIVHSPYAVVVHPVRPAGFAVALKQVKKVAFNALLYKKHPELYRARIQRYPPLRYYAMVLCWAVAGFHWFVGSLHVVMGALGLWAVLVLELTWRRLQRTRKSPQHIAEMLLTSALLAPAALYWRITGAIRFRVLFF